MEHRFNKKIYGGASFRAITNSYHTTSLDAGSRRSFIRIDENQIAAFADIYVVKSIVLGLEAGHSVLRKIRLGMADTGTKYYFRGDANDNLLLKIAVAYRLRLR
jgi:hypothetical protein